MKCPACNENEASTITFGLCDACIDYVYNDEVVDIIEKLTDRIAELDKLQNVIKDRDERIAELESRKDEVWKLIAIKDQIIAEQQEDLQRFADELVQAANY